MDTRRIKKLIELVKETGIGELEVKSGDESVRINCQTEIGVTPTIQAAAAPPAAMAQAIPTVETPAAESAPSKQHAEGHHVKSPMVGTVYLSSTPGDKPFVAIGDSVKIGDTLCLIEAMKMFNKIEADMSGTISARLIENQQPVEYDQPLFIIEASE
jgi:acetyl-CoA carboxylase biotin carboxyl carrier protein